MEIERKFLITHCPLDLSLYSYLKIQQAYLCTEPVIRIRRQDNTYMLTYKSKGMLIREEHNLPLTKEAYEHLRQKADGILLSKTRYIIPTEYNLKIELDIFDAPYENLQIAEVEFPTKESADHFTPLFWFGEEVTFSANYQNSTLSKGLQVRPFPEL